MKRKRMRDIVAEAQKRRALLLVEYNKLAPGTTFEEFGLKHGLTGERMGQLIKKAIEEAQNEKTA